jgi:undecaprenyl-diphosphatase
MEAHLLQEIHGAASPSLDALFWLSHQLGTGSFCAALVVLMAVIEAFRGRQRASFAWIVLGLSTFLLQLGIKELMARPRPQLWDGDVVLSSYAFPSGHALAAATFYPLMAWTVARRFPAWASFAYAWGIAMAFFVGFGRLYLGVHWPTDVLAGWALGALQLWAAWRFAARLPPAAPERASG